MVGKGKDIKKMQAIGEEEGEFVDGMEVEKLGKGCVCVCVCKVAVVGRCSSQGMFFREHNLT